jgi:hypothetical protein
LVGWVVGWLGGWVEIEIKAKLSPAEAGVWAELGNRPVTLPLLFKYWFKTMEEILELMSYSRLQKYFLLRGDTFCVFIMTNSRIYCFIPY